MTTNISSVANWNTYIGNNTPQDYSLQSDLRFDSTFAGNLNLQPGRIFEGNNKKIYLDNLSNFNGLFNLNSGNINSAVQNLTVVCANISIANDKGIIVNGSSDRSIRGNGSLNSVNVIFRASTLGTRSGGLVGRWAKNMTINNCYFDAGFTGSINTINGGGLFGSHAGVGVDGNINISDSWVKGVLDNSTGGLVGNDSVVNSISNSYMIGTANNNNGVTLGNTTITSRTNVIDSGSASTSISAPTSTVDYTSINSNINLLSGKVYQINNNNVLTNTTLGSGVVNSSLTSVGTLTGLTVSGQELITNTTQSTSSTTGALIVSGGIGVGGDVNVDGNVNLNKSIKYSTSLPDSNIDTSKSISFLNKGMGTAQWAANIAGTGNEEGRRICTDSLGGIYITGYTASNPITLYHSNGASSGITKNNSGFNDGFIAKYNSNGVVQWAANITGTNQDYCWGICADISGGIYISGWTRSNPVTFYHANGVSSGITKNNRGNDDGFIAKYNINGAVQWAANIAGTDWDQCQAICSDSSDGIYVTGYYTSIPITFYHANGVSSGISRSTLNSTFTEDCYIVKYNSSGVVQWAANIASNANDRGTAICADSSNSIYITGWFLGSSLNFYHANGSSSGITKNNSGSNDVFVAKYNSNGVVQWAANIAGTSIDYGQGICADNLGGIYITGYYTNTITFYHANGVSSGITKDNSGSNDLFIAKYNNNGDVQWAANITGIGAEEGNDICVDSLGGIYITGYTASNPVTLYNANGVSSGITKNNFGSNDCLIAKYNSNGVAQWAGNIAGTGDDRGYGICADSLGGIYITGSYTSNPITLYNANGASSGITKNNSGSGDCFIASYFDSYFLDNLTSTNDDGTSIQLINNSGSIVSINNNLNNIQIGSSSMDLIWYNNKWNSNPFNAYNGLFISDTKNSSSTTTGALVVNGGAGIDGNVNIGGNLNVTNIERITNTTQSTSTTTGALVVNGGAGIASNVNIGGNLNVTGSIYISGTNVQMMRMETAKSMIGLANVDFTGIPSWAKKITMTFHGTRINGTSRMGVYIGNVGGVDYTGYQSCTALISADTPNTAISANQSGFIVAGQNNGDIKYGHMLLTNATGNSWIESHTMYSFNSTQSDIVMYGGGQKTLSGTLDRIRITTEGNVTTFLSGNVNLLIEGY